MDFNELTLNQLIDAMKRTPSLALLKRLHDEIARFPAERDSLERIYKNQYRQFERSMTLRGRYGKCTLYWQGHVPYGICEWSMKLDKDLIFWDESKGDRIEYLKKLSPNMRDISDDYRWDRLFNPGLGTMPKWIPSSGTMPEQIPPFITGKLRKAIESTIFIPVPQETIEERNKIIAAEQEEIEREREIDRKNKEKQHISPQETKALVDDVTKELTKIKRAVRMEPIPPEIRKLYDRYVGVNPSYINLRAFQIFLRRLMEAFPNQTEMQELLDRVDFRYVIEAIKKHQKYGELLTEALNDVVKRLRGKNEIDVERLEEEVEELNKKVDLFTHFLDLLLKIYSQYQKEGDSDVTRGILRVLDEKFNIKEKDIPEIQSNIGAWVMDNLEFLGFD